MASAVLAAALALGAAGTAAATVPYEDYGKYVSITGPKGLAVGGGWGVWTLQAKNPNAAEDTTSHLLFNASYVPDTKQLQFEFRAGTSGAWAAAPVKWSQTGSDPKRPSYLASIDFTGAALDIAPHRAKTFQLRVRRLATDQQTSPFDTEFSAILTPKPAPDGQAGDFVARAEASVAPEGLTTRFMGLPTEIPADGRTREFKIRLSTANQADWHIPAAGFFLWQGQKLGHMSGPKPCDAEVDVRDPATHQWHRVGLAAQGLGDQSVDLVHWATGGAYDRTVTARITLGAGFRAAADASIGFGYFPGSGDPDHFWITQKLTSHPVAGAPACAKPASVAASPTASPAATTPGTGGPTPNSTGTSTQLAATGSDSTGLITALAAALVALGSTAFAATRRRARHG